MTHSLVIVPTHDERDNIVPFISAVLSVAPFIHVLIVDDASPDGTGIIADELARAESRIHVMHRSAKLGLGTAYIEGFRFALAHGYERIIEMDADFSHQPKDLLCLLEATDSADVAIGSRNIPGGRVEGWSLLRRCISKGGSLYTRALLGIPIRDCTSGFKCFRREVIANIDLDQITSNGYGFQVEMNYLCHRAGFRIVEIPIVFLNRTIGASKMSQSIVVEAGKVVWRLRQGRNSVPAGLRGAKQTRAVQSRLI
jgi:dolichol-phosphate mannosyltransferase